MLTQTHAFVSVALFGMNRSRTLVFAALAGALVPDSDTWVMSLAELLRGTPV